MRQDWVAKRKDDKIRTQMHYARQGIVTEEMRFVARTRDARSGTGPLRSGPRPDDRPRQRKSRQPGTHVHRRGFHVQDQLQHRQLGGDQRRCRGVGEARVLAQVRRRHGDGPLHRRRHPGHPQGHHRRFAGAHRDRAHLRSSFARAPRGGSLQAGDARSHRRAGRAGRGLHDHPRRRAGAAHPAGHPPRHRHREPRTARSWPSGWSGTTSRTCSTSVSRTSARSSRNTT